MIAVASSSVCWARLPRAGLGNLLLVWARAWVFPNVNGWWPN